MHNKLASPANTILTSNTKYNKPTNSRNLEVGAKHHEGG
jgi:hypothetical protein